MPNCYATLTINLTNMTQLTKEHFDEQLQTLVTKQDLNQKLAPLATKQDIRAAVEELAGMVKKGFDGVDRQLSEIVEQLDVRKDVDQLKLDVQEIRHALNIER